jgi:hypothetical protein
MSPPTKLALENAHARDVNISFEEGPHIYTVMGKRGTYTSVTTWVHQQFPHFDQDAIINKILANKKMFRSHLQILRKNARGH